MQFDECTPYDTKGHITTEAEARFSMELSLRWARAASAEFARLPIPTRCSASCRAACSSTCARSRWRAGGDGLPGYAVGGVSVGEPKEEMLRIVRTRRRRLPAAQAALPDGRGHAGGPGRRRGAGRRHVRLRHAHPQRAQRPPVHPLRRPEDPQRAHRTDERPLDETCSCYTCKGTRHVRAASRAPTCTTWTAAARCWRRCWPASTTCTST